MKYNWEERAVSAYYYDESGKIVASISRTSFSDDTWTAEVNGDRLGEFISFGHGKSAIEKFVKEMDEQIALLPIKEVSHG